MSDAVEIVFVPDAVEVLSPPPAGPVVAVPVGATGRQGPKGDTGAVGPQGAAGAQGAQGPAGPQGLKGDTGAVGPQGAAGAQGAQGAAGPGVPAGGADGSVLVKTGAADYVTAWLASTAFGKSLLALANAALLRAAVALPTVTTAGRLARYTDAAGGQGQTAGIYEDGAGKVGIGTTAPAQTLDVAGTIKGDGLSIGGALSWNSALKRLEIAASGGNSGHLFYTGSNSANLNFDGANFVTRVLGTGNLYFDSVGSGSTYFRNGGSWANSIAILGSGNVGIGTTAPTAKLDNAGDTYRQRVPRTPASASAAGNAGDMCWDASYFYVCVATNTWRRVQHATW